MKLESVEILENNSLHRNNKTLYEIICHFDNDWHVCTTLVSDMSQHEVAEILRGTSLIISNHEKKNIDFDNLIKERDKILSLLKEGWRSNIADYELGILDGKYSLLCEILEN